MSKRVRDIEGPGVSEPIVISPPPPKPVNALIQFKSIISPATPQPKHPREKVAVDTKKHTLRPKMSEKRPYRGWNAVLVTRYDVVSHDAVFAASKSELITAYVAAVMVVSKP